MSNKIEKVPIFKTVNIKKVLKRKTEKLLVPYGLRFLTRNTQKGTVRKMLSKCYQKLVLKRLGAVR